MLIDCVRCPVRGRACDDCVVGVLLRADPAAGHGAPAGRAPSAPLAEQMGLPLDPAERRAVAAFVAAGLLSREAAGGLVAQPDRAPALAV